MSSKVAPINSKSPINTNSLPTNSKIDRNKPSTSRISFHKSDEHAENKRNEYVEKKKKEDKSKLKAEKDAKKVSESSVSEEIHLVFRVRLT